MPPSTTPREQLDEYDLHRLELEKQLEEAENAFEKKGLVGYDRELSYIGNLQFSKPEKTEQDIGLHIDSIEMNDDDCNEDDEAIYESF